MAARRKRSGRDRNIKQVRYGLLGFAVAVAVVVLGYGLIYSTGATYSGEFVAGEHYRLIDNAPRRRPGAPIVVTEFFSYGCVHCRDFDPLVNDWKSGLPDDVRFERSPAAFNATWAMLARTYFVLEQAGALDANHDRIFRAIHDNGRQFATVDEIADFVAGRGIERQAFLDAYDSPALRRKVAEQNVRQRRLAIASTPMLAVGDRYVVGMDAGRRQALNIVDHLIELERGAAES